MERLFRFYSDKDVRNLWESALYDIMNVSEKRAANSDHELKIHEIMSEKRAANGNYIIASARFAGKE